MNKSFFTADTILLKEDVSHATAAHPYSLHYTHIDTSFGSALYLHWHAEAEFFYLESGSVELTIGETMFSLEAGDAVLIPPFLLHSARNTSSDSCSHYAFVFSPTFLSDSVKTVSYHAYLSLFYGTQGHVFRHADKSSYSLISELQAIFHYYKITIEQCELAIHGHFLLLCHALATQFLPTDQKEHLAALAAQLQPALTCLATQYATDLTLEELASHACLSREQFCRSFRKLTGMTPFSYLNRLRIQKSCDLLLHSSKKITDIASLCGFNNISYYNREFKKHLDMTPREYRTAASNSCP